MLVILFLIVDTLATTALPDTVPGRSPLAYWTVAAAAGVLFVGTLLGHELAHALVARRYRMRVHSITLWMLGGMARLEGQPPTARADLAVAAAGPLTSLVGSGLFGMLAWLAGVAGGAEADPGGAGLVGRDQSAAGGVQPAAGGAAGRWPGAAGAGVAADR